MERTILHIDFDSFFASCEQQFDEKLRGKPIGVTATNGRTCIIAASREAKKMGIKSPSRTWEAQKIVPQMIYVPAQFDRYWEITQKFLNICKDFSPFVELFSLDEVFIDITPTLHLFGADKRSAGARLLDRRGATYNIVNQIKERIKDEIGEFITVSVGISHNKLLAKLASGMDKPNGITEIKISDIEKIYSQIELTALCGIGERIKRRLNAMGIYNPLALRHAPLESLISEFKDVEGKFLYSLGQAIDNREVIPYYEASEVKSVGRNYCIPQNTYDQRKVLQHVYELCEEVGLKLRRIGKKGRTVGLYLGGNRSEHGRKTLQRFIDTGDDIFLLCKALYDEWKWTEASNPNDQMVRQISVWVGNLEDSSNVTLSIFDEIEKSKKLPKVVDQINDRFGDHTIRNGFLLYGPNLKTVPNGYMADKYERGKLVGKFDSI